MTEHLPARPAEPPLLPDQFDPELRAASLTGWAHRDHPEYKENWRP